jgi:DNA-binding CsgD family transcriptional regulator
MTDAQVQRTQVTLRHEIEGLLDARQFLEIGQACASCASEADFATIVRTLVRPVLPHGLLAAVVGRIDIEHLEMLRFVGVDYPPQAVASMPQALNVRERPVVQSWLANREPLVLSLPRDASLMSHRERTEITAFGLGRLAIHGTVDVNASAGYYLSFGQVDEVVSEAHLKSVLRLIAPPLTQALANLHQKAACDSAPSLKVLSKAERELLAWVAAGRSNAEIAQLRGRSVATVRNQLHSVFVKLNVSNRVEAARLASRSSQ